MINEPDPKPPARGSTPDLAHLDAAWETSNEELPESPESAQASLEEVDEGWETVPVPDGGPPARRRRSPKERARLKREKQRAKAEAASQKQKAKQRPLRGAVSAVGERRDANGRPVPSSPPSPATDATTRKDAPRISPREASSGAPRTRAARRVKRRLDRQALASIGVALLVAGAALYYMLSRP